ncbi:hypothetical protein MNBD_NITROSPINAE02-82 [hydrothermal vent metagenome]|uniref:Uncharacterized protein n=1 Tax=hydrothermal vent metagenome TaxID=652676 RepID=A0A3B1BV28_9ZZZZ
MRVGLFVFTILLAAVPGVSVANICWLEEPCDDCILVNGDTLVSNTSPVKNCKTVQVIKGGINLGSLNKSGSPKFYSSIKKGTTIRLDVVEKKNFVVAAYEMFIWIAKGAPKVNRAGMSLSENHGLPSFPNGRILLVVDEIILATDTAKGLVTKFTLHGKKSRKSLASRIDRKNKSIHIPAGEFSPGGRYVWRAVIGGDNYSGKFSVVKAKVKMRFDDALQESLKGSRNNESTRYLISAILANKKGYPFDVAQAIDASRRAKAKGR